MTSLSKVSRVYISGHSGLVGSAVVRRLQNAGFTNLVTATLSEVDLREPHAVDAWFAHTKPDYVIHVAGTVGGILANSTRPVDFLYDNLLIHATVLRSAWKYGVRKLLYLGSSCIYPRDCPQPIREEYLLTGPLEPTNEAYALAKITGLRSCEYYRRQHGCNFISAMPTNLYGPGDRFDPDDSHVLPALIRKFHEAKIQQRAHVAIWGTGTPKREFLHVDDLADACLFLMDCYEDGATINVGSGEELTILELANLVRDIVYPEAELTFDTTKPDGTPRKVLDSSRLRAMGWKPTIPLKKGIERTYEWYIESVLKDCQMSKTE